MAKRVIKRAVSILAVPDYMSRLKECYENILNSDNYYSMSIELTDVYRTLKRAGSTLCIGKSNCFYEKLRNKVIDCEELCENAFIVESKPAFDTMDVRFYNKSIVDISKNDLLEYIVWFTRLRLLGSHQDKNPMEIVDFNKLHLTNDCKLASNIIKLLCDTLKVPCEVIKIPAAFTDEFMLYGGNGFHYFCIVTIDSVEYIVDATYRQFFTLDTNNIERLGVMGLDGCHPGVYMMMNKSRKNTAINILKKGYIVANDENLKNYFDGFALSYRNGLYYEWIGEASYTTDYTVEDYFKFLAGDELFFDYEPVEFLGEQEEPLKNYKFRFKN